MTIHLRWNGPAAGKCSLLARCIGLAFFPALTGFAVRPGEWYKRLRKPALQPPGWIFGPVWTALYLTVGLAHYRFLTDERSAGPRATANALYGLQLGLNAAWTPLFFGLKSPALAFVDLALLLPMVRATERAFNRVSPAAARLLWPYLGWVCFAAYLNAAICLLNAQMRPSGRLPRFGSSVRAGSDDLYGVITATTALRDEHPDENPDPDLPG